MFRNLWACLPSKNSEENKINPSRSNHGWREKIKLNLFFTLLCGTSKGFLKAFKVFIKPFEVPQRRVKIKVLTWFLFQYNLKEMHGMLRIKVELGETHRKV